MGIALVVVVAVPIIIVLLAVCLRSLYGDQLFSLSWPAHDLNNPDDPRILKLNLNEPKISRRNNTTGVAP